MEKPKTFWTVRDNYVELMDEKRYTRKEDALVSAERYSAEERCTVHVFQCTPVMTYNPVVEEKSWD